MSGGSHFPRLVQPFPPGMATPPVELPAEPAPAVQPAAKTPVPLDRGALMARIAKLKPHSRRRLELEARLVDLTCRQLEAELERQP